MADDISPPNQSFGCYVQMMADSWGLPDFLCVREDLVTVFNDELHCDILGVHVGHLFLQAQVSHDSRRKDDCKVLGRHLECVSSMYDS